MKRNSNILFLVLILLFSFSCSNQSWTKDEKNENIFKCREEGGSKKYCECFIEVLMEKYPIAADVEKLDFETKVELSKGCED